MHVNISVILGLTFKSYSPHTDKRSSKSERLTTMQLDGPKLKESEWATAHGAQHEAAEIFEYFEVKGEKKERDTQ